jgi:hypothetical protein
LNLYFGFENGVNAKTRQAMTKLDPAPPTLPDNAERSGGVSIQTDSKSHLAPWRGSF